METSPRQHQQENPNSTMLRSPNSHSSNSGTSSTNSNHNGLQAQAQAPPTTPTAQPPPRPITRSESANPYPTTFVQADTSSFKQVVQMLTGSSETAKNASSKPPCPDPKTHIPPVKTTMPKRQQQSQSGFKLYERRNSLKNLRINPLVPVFGSGGASSFSPRNPEILSPSILDFPALVLSPVTPLIPDPFDRSGPGGFGSNHGNGCSNLNKEAEERAIKEKGFYLHPSPSTTPRESEPRLLPLFPTTSPRAASGSSS